MTSEQIVKQLFPDAKTEPLQDYAPLRVGVGLRLHPDADYFVKADNDVQVWMRAKVKIKSTKIK